MKIAIGCDPNAQQAKEELIKFMEDKGYGEIKDFGSEDPIYANTAVAVAEVPLASTLSTLGSELLHPTSPV